MKPFFVFTLIFLLFLPTPLSANFSQDPKEISVDQKRDLKNFVINFFTELEETRDFTPLVDKYFVESFGKCSLGGEILGENGTPTDKIGAFNLLHIDSKIVKDIPEALLKRLFISSLNFFHSRFYSPFRSEADDEYKKILTQLETYKNNDKNLQKIKQNQVIGSIKEVEAFVLFQEYAFSLTQNYVSSNLEVSQKKYEKYFKYNETEVYKSLETFTKNFTIVRAENYDFIKELCPVSTKNPYYSTGVSGYYTLVLTKINNTIKIVAIYPDQS